MATIWAGLGDDDLLDVELLKLYGVPLGDAPATEDDASDEYRRFKICLQVACQKWEHHTGRIYGADRAFKKHFHINRFSYEMMVGIHNSETIVRFRDPNKVTWTTLVAATEGFGSVLKYTTRGTYDTLVKVEPWELGEYEITADWGEVDVPDDVQFAVIRYASHIYAKAQTPGATAIYSFEDGVKAEPMPPYEIYQLMMLDKVPFKVAPVMV